MPTRRRLLTAAGATAAAGMAGCTDLFGDGPITFAAERATVPAVVRNETGHDEAGIEELVIEETVEVGDRSRDVQVTNWQAEYDKAIDLPVGDSVRAAVCTVLSTPRAEVLGRTFNPIAEMEPRELIRQFQDRIEGIENVRHVGEESAATLDTAAEVGRFEAEGTVADGGQQVDLELLVTESVASGDDLVLAVAAYPEVLADAERPDALAMIEGIDHPT